MGVSGERDGWPEFKIIALADVGRFIGRVLRFMPEEAPDYMSEHYRGAEAMLVRLDQPVTDEALFNANLSGFGYEPE